MKKLFQFILIISAYLVQAQAPDKFYNRFGGFGHDIGYGVIQTLNGQYAVTGSTSSFGFGNTDAYLALVDSMGWVRWEKSFGGFNNDIGKSIIQLKDSGFVIAGYTNSFGSGGYDVFVVRTDKNGTLIWQKAFGGMDWDFGNCVKEVNGGDSLIICGNTYSYGYGKSDGYIIKTDINGNFQWQKTFGGAEDDEFKSFVLTYNNLYAFAGTTKSQGDVKGDCWIMKTGLNGDSVLNIKYGNSNKQFLNNIEEHPVNHNFYVCGGYDQAGFDSTSAMLLSFSENGLFQFNDIYTYHERKDEQYTALAYSKNNDYLYVRKCSNSNIDNRLEPMISLFSNNTYIANTKYGSSEDDELHAISKTKNKGFVCVGYTKGFNASLSDVFLLKLDSNSLVGAASIIGVNEITANKSSIIIYPTVTSNQINIENINSETYVSINISNQLGLILKTLRIKEKNATIEIGELPDGIYYITIEEKQTNKVFKILKTE